MKLATMLTAILLTKAIGTDSKADLGSWRVGKILDIVQNYLSNEKPLTEKQARRELAKYVEFITEKGPKSCPTSREVRTEKRDGLVGINQLPLENHLDLPENVTVFTYDCFEMWQRKDGSMTAGIDGYWFELHKVNPPQQNAKLK
jgi:hypothetical protein